MSGTEKSSQLNNEQIEELVREYSQFYEENSQVIQESESQCLDYSISSTPEQFLDFQAEFLKCMLKPDEIEMAAVNAKSAYDQASQLEYNSQTDVETVIRAYMTGNPDWNENIASKPFNLEAFLQSRDFFVTLKTGLGHEPVRSTVTNTREIGKSNRFTLGPLPLEIEDILRIGTNCDETQRWNGYQKIYGQNFKTVMFYGRCKPSGLVKSQKNRNVKLYEIDDGSGMIVVHFPHFDGKYSALNQGIEQLFADIGLAKKEGIPFLGTEHYGPRTSRCKEIMDNLNIVANVIKRNSVITQDFFTHGSKMCGIGRVFSHIDGTNHVFAYHMIEDSVLNRDFEVKFKKHLLEVYETKYMKYKITGESINPAK